MLRSIGQPVGARPQVHGGGHDQLFADRVDRRVGYLGKELAEVLIKEACPTGEDRESGIVSHRSGGLFAFLNHRQQDDFEFLLAVTKGEESRGEVGRHGWKLRGGGGEGLQTVFHPLAVRFFGGGEFFNIGVAQKFFVDRINRNHFARGETTFFNDRFFGNVADPDLGPHKKESILGDFIAGRAKAVTIEAGGDDFAVAKGKGGRTIPRLVQAFVIFVEGANVGREGILRAIGGGDEHEHGVQGASPGNGEEFERVIETGGVASAGLNDRVEKRKIGGVEPGMRKVSFPRVNPVAIAAEGIDLAIVGDHTKGVCEGPGGEGVGAVALVKNSEGSFVGGILQIEIKAFELGAGQHPFVDDGAGTEGGNIERRGTIGGATVFDFVSRQEEGHFESIVGKFFGIGPSHKELFDPRSGKGGFFPKDAGIDGDDAPTERDETAAGDDFLGDTANVGLGVLILGWKKEEADPEVSLAVELVAEFFNLSAEEFGGDLGQDAGSVPRLGVRIEGATMGELANTTQGAFQNGAGAATLNVGDNTHAASIVLLGRVIEPLRSGHRVVEGEPRHVSFTILHETMGARVGILLRGREFGGIVGYGPCSS